MEILDHAVAQTIVMSVIQARMLKIVKTGEDGLCVGQGIIWIDVGVEESCLKETEQHFETAVPIPVSIPYCPVAQLLNGPQELALDGDCLTRVRNVVTPDTCSFLKVLHRWCSCAQIPPPNA